VSFDKLIELLNASTKVAFGLAFAAVVIFVGQYYKQWPFMLLQGELGYILVGGLLGAGILLFQLLRFFGQLAWALALLGYYAVRLWRKNQNVMSRLGDLTLEQQADLLWIAHHPKAIIEGSPLVEPFRGLRNKGFIFLTDETLFPQAFRVNRKVYSSKAKIGANFNRDIYDAIVQGDAPWKRRNLY
jgi:hypothetical protein